MVCLCPLPRARLGFWRGWLGCTRKTLEQMREDVLLVAERLLAFYEGGLRPTYEDIEFIDVLDRMHARSANAPVPFNRRTVNAALGRLRKEPPCNSASK